MVATGASIKAIVKVGRVWAAHAKQSLCRQEALQTSAPPGLFWIQELLQAKLGSSPANPCTGRVPPLGQDIPAGCPLIEWSSLTL